MHQRVGGDRLGILRDALGLGHAFRGNTQGIDAAAQGIGEYQVSQIILEQLGSGVDRHVLGHAGTSRPGLDRLQLVGIESAGLHTNGMDGVARLAQPHRTIRGVETSGKRQHGLLGHSLGSFFFNGRRRFSAAGGGGLAAAFCPNHALSCATTRP